MTRRGWLRAVVPTWLFALACASARPRIPDSLRGYEIVVSHRDSLSDLLVRALREGGFHVRRGVRGGGPPAAGLIHFAFREPEPNPVPWLHVRLFDTRSGIILAAVVLRLDSIPPDGRSRARLAVDSLLAQMGGGQPSP